MRRALDGNCRGGTVNGTANLILADGAMLTAGWTSGTKTQYDTDGTGIYEKSVELMGNPSAQLFRVRVTDNPLGAIPSGSAQ